MAKRFRFRLETVLKLRKRREDECRRVVADRLRRVGHIKARIATCTTQLHEAFEATRADQGMRKLDPAQARRNRAYINAMYHLIEQAKKDLNQETVHLHEEQQRLVEASRDVKVIEKLKERQWQRHQTEQEREERLEADEIAMQLYRRNRGDRSRDEVAPMA